MRYLYLAYLMILFSLLFVGCVAPIAENIPLTEQQSFSNEITVDVNYGNVTYNFICNSTSSNVSYNVTHYDYIKSTGKNMREQIVGDTKYIIFEDTITTSPNIDYLVPLSMNITNDHIYCNGQMQNERFITIEKFNKETGQTSIVSVNDPTIEKAECIIDKSREFCGINGEETTSRIHQLIEDVIVEQSKEISQLPPETIPFNV